MCISAVLCCVHVINDIDFHKQERKSCMIYVGAYCQ